jgi:transposase
VLMRGTDERTAGLFSYVRLEDRVAADHPLRAIRGLVEEVLERLSARLAGLYSHTGRPSIPPEQMLKATLLQAFFSVRSERQLMEQLDYNLLFRWFVGLELDDKVWDASTFSKNRDRLLEADVAREFLTTLMGLGRVKRLLSSDHFSVDGTLIEAWASMKSFRRKNGSDEPPGPGRNGERDFRREKRSNETHASTTDPDARLFRKANGQESRLAYLGHALMENRNGLIVDAQATHATGTAERETALAMIERSRQKTGKPVPRDARRQALRCGQLHRRTAGAGHHPACRDQRHGQQAGQGQEDPGRQAHHPPPRLHRQPADQKAHRGRVRMGQDHRRLGQAQGQGPRQSRCRLHLPNDRLQPHPNTQTHRPTGMRTPQTAPITAHQPAPTAGRVQNTVTRRPRSPKTSWI